MCTGRGKYTGYTGLTYQAECGQLVGWWLLELCGEGTAVGCCGENRLCVMSVSQLSVLQLEVKILQQFECLRKSTIGFVRWVWLSFCSHGRTGLQRDGIARNVIYIYIYIYAVLSKICRKFKRDWIMGRKPVMYMKMYSWCGYGNIWLYCYQRE